VFSRIGIGKPLQTVWLWDDLSLGHPATCFVTPESAICKFSVILNHPPDAEK